MKTIYISGKITGLAQQEVEAKFLAAFHKMKKADNKVISPVWLVQDMAKDLPWQEYMKVCIAELTQCDIIYMLPCWTDSRGAQLELHIAASLGIEILFENQNHFIINKTTTENL